MPDVQQPTIEFAPRSVRVLTGYALIGFTLFLTACASGDSERIEDVLGSPPGTLKTESKRFVQPQLQVATWPFDDGRSQYRLIWSGGDSKLPLFSDPDPNSQLVAEVSYEDGQEIQTVGDYVSVYRPSIYRTRRSMEIKGVVASPTGQPEAPFSRQLKRGSSVAVYLYAGGTSCYLGVGGRLVIAPCPDPDNYSGSFEGDSLAVQMQPLSKIWWVRISTPIASGWVPLDDRVIADIFPLEMDAPPLIGELPDRTPDVETPESDDTESKEFSDREDELFGGSNDGVAETSQDGGQATSLGGPLLSEDDISERLDAKSDPLSLSAFAFLQLNYLAFEEGDPEDFPLSAPALLDVRLDARPSQRVRAVASGRLNVDFAGSQDTESESGDPVDTTRVDLDQLWINFDVDHTLFMTVGKQRIRWGTGRFWNPTDFLNRTPQNPLNVAVFDRRLGVTLAKLHLPIESLGWNLYTFALLEGAGSPEGVGGGVRAEFLLGLTELSLSATAQRDQPIRAGLDLSTGVWLFDFRIEAAALLNDPRTYFEGTFDLPREIPTELSRQDEVIAQVVAGFDLEIPYRRGDSLIVGAEYFFNDAGYDDVNIYPWLFRNNTFEPFYIGRHYAGLYAVLANPGAWDDTTIVSTLLGNLSDRSFIGRIDLNQEILSYLRWNVFWNAHFGENGEFNYGLEILPNVFAPEGAKIEAPFFQVGTGLQIDL